MSPRPRVLILRALGLGDLLTAVPALSAIRTAFGPDHHVVLATTPALCELALHLRVVDEVAAVSGLSALPDRLHRSDVAVNLHGRGPQSHRVLQRTRPGRLIAFAHEAAQVDGPQWRAGEHEVARWCRLLTESGIPADRRRLDIPRPGWRPPSAIGATVIHPGAASPSRRWPGRRWAEVARVETAQGRRVILTGSAADADRCRRIAADAGLPESASWAGRTSLVDLAAVVAVSDLVLSADTGIAHLASALRRPSVVLFGPVPPAEWGPPADRPIHVALWAGGRGDPHGDDIDPGLQAITVGDVLAGAERARAAADSGPVDLDYTPLAGMGHSS